MSLKLEWQNAQLMTCKSMPIKPCRKHWEINKAVMQLELKFVFWEKIYIKLSGYAELMYFTLHLRVVPYFLHRRTSYYRETRVF